MFRLHILLVTALCVTAIILPMTDWRYCFRGKNSQQTNVEIIELIKKYFDKAGIDYKHRKICIVLIGLNIC